MKPRIMAVLTATLALMLTSCAMMASRTPAGRVPDRHTGVEPSFPAKVRTCAAVSSEVPVTPFAPSRQTGMSTFDPESPARSSGSPAAPVPVPEPTANPAKGNDAQPLEASTNGPAQTTSDVVLRPGLVVRIDVHVLGKKEVEEPSRRVGEQGEITLPLLGVVKVAGRTIDGLAADLQKEYSKFLVNPQVVVEFVTDRNSGGAMPWGYVTVLGRVKKSGRVFIPATRDLTVSAAIQETGGLDTSAKDTAIRLTRVNPDGTTETQEVNLRAVGAKGEIEGDVILRPGDIVYVPELVF